MLASLPISIGCCNPFTSLGGSYEFPFYIFKKVIIRIETMKIAQVFPAFKCLGQIQTQDWLESHVPYVSTQYYLLKSSWDSCTLHKPLVILLFTPAYLSPSGLISFYCSLAQYSLPPWTVSYLEFLSGFLLYPSTFASLIISDIPIVWGHYLPKPSTYSPHPRPGMGC